MFIIINDVCISYIRLLKRKHITWNRQKHTKQIQIYKLMTTDNNNFFNRCIDSLIFILPYVSSLNGPSNATRVLHFEIAVPEVSTTTKLISFLIWAQVGEQQTKSHKMLINCELSSRGGSRASLRRRKDTVLHKLRQRGRQTSSHRRCVLTHYTQQRCTIMANRARCVSFCKF